MTHLRRLALFLVIVAVFFGILILGWGWARFASDFWPPDKASVGPNLVAAVVQGVVVGAFALIFWPPFREAANRWVRGHLHAHHAEIQRRLDHIIEHSPDIPDLPEK